MENKELIKRERVKNTPFYTVGNHDNGYFVALGKFKLTDNFDTPQEAQEQIDGWDFLLALINMFVSEIIKNHYNNDKQHNINQ